MGTFVLVVAILLAFLAVVLWKMFPARSDNFKKNALRYHEVRRSIWLGYNIGNIGAMWHLLDRDGNQLSRGYHGFSRIGLIIFGNEGSHTEMVVNMSGKIESWAKPEADYKKPATCKPIDLFHEAWYDDRLGYNIGQCGAMRYLLNLDGAKVSPTGHHEYFRDKGVLYGKTGGRILAVINTDGTINPEPETPATIPATCQPKDFFHTVWFDSELGYNIGQIGAMKHLLDQAGNTLTLGYHEFFSRHGMIYGQIGDTTEPVVSGKQPKLSHGLPY